LPANTPAPVTVQSPDGAVRDVAFTSTLRDLRAGLYQVQAYEQTDNPSVRYVPDISEARIQINRDDREAAITYVPACDTLDFEAREACYATPWYPQGYITQNRDGGAAISGTIQILNASGTSYVANEITRGGTIGSYFSLSLPRVLSPFQMDTISNVMRAFTFGDQSCTRESISISNPNVRGNDLFMDIYRNDGWDDSTEFGEDDIIPDSKIGEVFLFNSSDNQLVLWVYANGETRVTGSELCDQGTLNFDLDLDFGWNLVAFVFDEKSDGVTIRRVDSQDSFRAFHIMPTNIEDLEDLNEPNPSVFFDQLDTLANRPFGYMNLPLDAFKEVRAPFRSAPKVSLAIAPGPNATSVPLDGVAGWPGSVPIAEFDTRRASETDRPFDLTTTVDLLGKRLFDGETAVSSTDGADAGVPLPGEESSDFLYLREFPLMPTDRVGKKLCNVALSASSGESAIDQVWYATLDFEILTGSNGTYSGYATLMYDNTAAAWWFVPADVTITGEQNCEGLQDRSLMQYDYQLDLKAGWNVVYTVLTTPINNEGEPVYNPDQKTVIDALVTTNHLSLTDIDFLYWRVFPDNTRAPAFDERSSADRGSTNDTIRGQINPCSESSLVRCARDDIARLEAELHVYGINTDGPLSPTEAAYKDEFFAGNFTIALPIEVSVADITALSPNDFIPAQTLFPEGLCTGRVVSASDTAFVLDTELLFLAGDDRIGTAALRGTKDAGRTETTISWVYANEAMSLAWKTPDGCVYEEVSTTDEQLAVDNRKVVFAIDLELEAGWNMVSRTSTIPAPNQTTAPQTFTWSVVEAVPSDVRWVVEVTNPCPDRSNCPAPGTTAAASLGFKPAAFNAAVEAASTPATRSGRSILRSFIESGLGGF
jgi:hypothetical protein